MTFSKGRTKSFLLVLLSVGAVVATLVYAAAAWSSSSTPADKQLFYSATTSDEVLSAIVTRARANGVSVAEFGIRTEPTAGFQVVLGDTTEIPAIAAHEVWRQAAFAKARGEAVPMVEVFRFDAEGKLVFGLGKVPEDVVDISYGYDEIALPDARNEVSAVIRGAVADGATGAARDPVAIEQTVSEDPEAGRVVSVVLRFPAAASDEEVEVVVGPMIAQIGHLNESRHVGVGVVRATVFRGDGLLLEEIYDLQLNARSGWHAPSFLPSWLSRPEEQQDNKGF